MGKSINWPEKSVLITGAGTGIGRALAKELASRGALVFVSALTLEEAQSVVDEITARNHRGVALQLDVTDDAQYQTAMDAVVAQHGSLDVLINNAGLAYVGEYFDMDEPFMRKLIEVNVTAVAIGTLYGYRIMKEQGQGLIVNVASMGGVIPVGSIAAYSGTKHAVMGLTASVGGEAEDHGVELKVICPGNVASEMLNKAQTRGTNAEGVLEDLPKVMPTEVAVVKMVDRLSGKSKRIFVPWYAHAMYIMQRIWPNFGHVGARESIRKFRAKRDDSLDQL